MHVKTFQVLNKKLHQAAMAAVEQNLKEVRIKVKDFHEEEQFLQDTQSIYISFPLQVCRRDSKEKQTSQHFDCFY
jgi:hypothetical protein